MVFAEETRNFYLFFYLILFFNREEVRRANECLKAFTARLASEGEEEDIVSAWISEIIVQKHEEFDEIDTKLFSGINRKSKILVQPPELPVHSSFQFIAAASDRCDTRFTVYSNPTTRSINDIIDKLHLKFLFTFLGIVNVTLSSCGRTMDTLYSTLCSTYLERPDAISGQSAYQFIAAVPDKYGTITISGQSLFQFMHQPKTVYSNPTTRSINDIIDELHLKFLFTFLGIVNVTLSSCCQIFYLLYSALCSTYMDVDRSITISGQSAFQFTAAASCRCDSITSISVSRLDNDSIDDIKPKFKIYLFGVIFATLSSWVKVVVLLFSTLRALSVGGGSFSNLCLRNKTFCGNAITNMNYLLVHA